MKKTLGGDRLGSGKRMQVELQQFERSTHDLGSILRTTMASGTVVPIQSLVALPGDTFDLDYDVDIQTHPTVGPLFGSFKVQIDVFMIPMRLYVGVLHNNELGIGMRMKDVKLPQLQLISNDVDNSSNPDNQQVNPSSIFAYLGIRGLGQSTNETAPVARQFNAIPWIAYWDIYKNYYANKQEEIGVVIHNPAVVNQTITASVFTARNGTNTNIPQDPAANDVVIDRDGKLNFQATSPRPVMDTVMLLVNGVWVQADQVFGGVDYGSFAQGVTLSEVVQKYRGQVLSSWRYINKDDVVTRPPRLETFPLENIDKMRAACLTTGPQGVVINYNTSTWYSPYTLALEGQNTLYSATYTQEGLGVKTYQSDKFNNWLKTEWLDGPNGVNELSAIDVSSGILKIDQINIAEKVYKMMNAVAASGGSYDDWQDAIWNHNRQKMVSSPVYVGGLSKELIFQEVVSNSAAESDGEGQPLGTLAGRGRMSEKHKGGRVTVKVDEPAYIMANISLTPRLDYSQGNKWDVNLKTLDELHKPALDEIGFQDLPTDEMAWWDTQIDPAGTVIYKSAGKQPAWLNYMTDVNQVLGNFAIEDNEMFMVLNRKYEPKVNGTQIEIKDLTTYIDPEKFNHIFAQTSLDAQNFWVQVRKGVTARRKMSAKVMPNL